MVEGGGSILSTEESHFCGGEVQDNWRLSCQVAIKQDLKIEIPEDAIGVKRWECEVIEKPNVATFIKELNLKRSKVRTWILEPEVMSGDSSLRNGLVRN